MCLTSATYEAVLSQFYLNMKIAAVKPSVKVVACNLYLCSIFPMNKSRYR